MSRPPVPSTRSPNEKGSPFYLYSFIFLLFPPLLPIFNFSLLISNSPSLAQSSPIPDRKAEAEKLLQAGKQLIEKGQFKAALEQLQEALQYYQQLQDRNGEVTTLNELGRVYEGLSDYARMGEAYQKALELAKAIGNRNEEGNALNGVGFIYFYKGEYTKAQESCRQALTIFNAMRNRKGEAQSFNNIAALHSVQGQYPKALEFYQQALEITKVIGDRAGEGQSLNSIGFIYERLGQYPKALEFYQQAIAISKATGDRSTEGTTLNNIGFIYHNLGQYPKALEFYQQALAISKVVGDRSTEGTTLNNIGLTYSNLGQYPKALEFYQQALTIFNAIGNRSGEGTTLNNIGLISNNLGQYSKALEFYQQALTICKEVGDRSGESTTLNNIGLTYSNLGQYSKALEFYQQALAIRKAIGDRSGEANSLNNIGGIYSDLGQYPKALEFYQQALDIRKGIGDRTGEGIAFNNIGLIYYNLGQYPKALEYYQQALGILKAIGDLAGEGTTLNNIGLTYDNLEQYPKALEYYQQALRILKEVGDRSTEGKTLNNIGFLLEAQKQTEMAIVFLKQAVSTYEAIREELRTLPKEQQQSYTETVASTYRRLADILLQQDRVLEAQQVLDLLKVQEVEDYLRNVRGNPQELIILRPEAEILKRYTQLQGNAIQLGQELTQLRKLPPASRTAAQQERISQLVKLEEEINQQFNQFIKRPEIQALVSELQRVAPGETISTASFNRLRNNLKQLGNAVLLYPLILDDRLELVITTPNSPPLRRVVPVKRADLNRAIANYRSALEKRQEDVKTHAQTLYNWLIKPLEADLKQANAQTIIYAPDGQLRYIPLAALYDGNQWLIQRFRVNNITAVSLDELNPQPAVPLTILAGAFANQQLQYEFPTRSKTLIFRGLPFAGKEVASLGTLVAGTKEMMDKAFSLQAMKPLMNDYSVLHFATHAAFLPGEPTESFIVFGDGSRARLNEIGDWTLNNVALVVLSACETGLALTPQGTPSQQDGREVLGLGYQFQRAGARATIASLWQVDDGGTQVLMDAFYAALKQGMPKAQALQEAQKALITGNYSTVGGKRSDVEIVDSRTGQPRTISSNTLTHPYYWAPFILIGNGL